MDKIKKADSEDDPSTPVLKKPRVTQDKDCTPAVVAHNEGTQEGVPNVENAIDEECKPVPTLKLKKRKCALFLSYCGANYQGMQRNPGARTIEEELQKALHASGAILDGGLASPREVEWNRAARTDKGVSALFQVVSATLFADAPGFLEETRKALPPDIRLLDCIRVIKSFSAKVLCDRRKYEYVIPAFAFDPSSGLSREQRREKEWTAADLAAEQGREIDEPSKADADSEEPFEFDEAKKEQLQSVLKHFEGTHDFHNFTSRISANDTRVQRFIVSFEVGDVFSLEGVQFVQLKVVGQSFILHQIRKMVGVAVAVMRNVVPVSFIAKSLKKENKMCLPTAPEVGLFLEECIFASYNKSRQRGEHAEISAAAYSEEIEEFKRSVIYPRIVSDELKLKSVQNWLTSLTPVNHPDFATEEAAVEATSSFPAHI